MRSSGSQVETGKARRWRKSGAPGVATAAVSASEIETVPEVRREATHARSEAAYVQSTGVALRTALVSRAAQPQIAAVTRNLPQPLNFPLDPNRDVVGLGAGDSFLVANFLTREEADASLHALLPDDLGGAGEVPWMQMYGKDGRPFARLKTTQADADPTAMPIYRYPTNNQEACETDAWTDTMGRLRDRVAALVGQTMNHCVGNLYRHERDFIGAHKDKMLDIKEGSAIASLSLGAQRPMVLEHEDGGQTQVVPLRHGSLLIIGPETNLHWTHSIPKEATSCGPRVSLTLREMGTFRDIRTGLISGQGAAWTQLSGLPRTLPPSRFQDPNWPLWEHDLNITPTIAFGRKDPLSQVLTATHVEGGSTFDCTIWPCTDAAEILRLQEKLREDHPEACHIPCAWLLPRQRSQPSQTRQSHRGSSGSRSCAARGMKAQSWDADGEPVIRSKGEGQSDRGEAMRVIDTARDGIYLPLKESQFTACAAFVVRHWDGKKLGARRLVAAYEAAVNLALASPPKKPNHPDNTVAVCVEARPAEQEGMNTETAKVHSPRAKEVRKLQKALREIADLECRRSAGEVLRSNQESKVAKRAEYSLRLEELRTSGVPEV